MNEKLNQTPGYDSEELKHQEAFMEVLRDRVIENSDIFEDAKKNVAEKIQIKESELEELMPIFKEKQDAIYVANKKKLKLIQALESMQKDAEETNSVHNTQEYTEQQKTFSSRLKNFLGIEQTPPKVAPRSPRHTKMDLELIQNQLENARAEEEVLQMLFEELSQKRMELLSDVAQLKQHEQQFEKPEKFAELN